VVVLDSVNAKNNITALWTEQTRLAYLERIQERMTRWFMHVALNWMGTKTELLIVGVRCSAQTSAH